MQRDELETIVTAASWAPSVHNTQPWRFTATADRVDIFADRSRLLSVIDPLGRELTISCGAAVLFARLAVRGLGKACTVSLLPDPADPDHLARILIGKASAPTAEERQLIRALPIRYTDRDRFDDRPVPPALIEELSSAAAEEGAWLRLLDRTGDLASIAVLTARADDMEKADPAYLAELVAWSRVSPDAPDGVPRAAVPRTPVSERGSSVRLRDFDVDHRDTAGSVSPLPPPAEHPLLALLGTPGDDPWAWLAAGQALGRLLLRAAAAGVTASPMTQVLEVATTRAQLARSLHILGSPQMLLRFGYGRGRPTTNRRAVSAVLPN